MSMTIPLDTDRFWTLDEFLALPEDLPVKVDLVEGRLRVWPRPSPGHQLIARRMAAAIEAAAGADWQVITDVGLLFSEHPTKPTVHCADAAVIASSHDLWDYEIRPHEVLLVVEVVSRSTRRKDRVENPHHCAKAGISYYWRVETPRTSDGLRVFTYRLDGGIYVPSGEFGDLLKVEEPFPPEFEVPGLIR